MTVIFRSFLNLSSNTLNGSVFLINTAFLGCFRVDLVKRSNVEKHRSFECFRG